MQCGNLIEDEKAFRFLTIKSEPGKISETEDFVSKKWKELFPDLPYQATLQSDVFNNYFGEIVGHSRLMIFTSVLATILAAMGLFGLVSLKVASRFKEFSIRKVMGANIGTLARNLNLEFIWLLIISFFIGGPLSYYLLVNLFNSIYGIYHIEVQIWYVFLGFLILLLTCTMTVSSQLLRVLSLNPVESLRNE